MSATTHYDNLGKHSYTINRRVHLTTINLRNFNNARKRCLLTRFVWPQAEVLDLCGGKGGDLHKYADLRVRRVKLIDASAASIEEAQRRYTHSALKFDFETQCGDMIHLEEYAPEKSVDVVSCQFAIHYAFEFPETTAAHVIERVARCLKPNGVFLVTAPNHTRVRQFRNNRMCRIKYLEHKRNAYSFWLDGAVDAIEFEVHFDTFVQLCKQHDLVLVHYEDFSNYRDRALRWEERAIASLYCEYAFQKQVRAEERPQPLQSLAETFSVNKVWLTP